MPTLPALATHALLQEEQGGAEGSPPVQERPPGLFGGNFLVPMLLIVGIFYFVLIRPERRKQKQRDAMLQAMKKGDRVMTSSGMFGSIAQIQDDVVTLQVADGVRLRFNRAAIQTVLDGEKTEEKAGAGAN